VKKMTSGGWQPVFANEGARGERKDVVVKESNDDVEFRVWRESNSVFIIVRRTQ
jgi:hypothetical protein